MTPIFAPACRIDHLSSFYNFHTAVDVLRLDLVHPVVSGNKWFKLSHYLIDAGKNNKKTILSFGGAYSNHIVAIAAAARFKGLKSIGIIRGERALSLSQTLQEAMNFGMELFFISKEAYKEKLIPKEVKTIYPADDLYIIPEGGYGNKGMLGGKDILLKNETASYTHIVSAVGTGTTLAGLVAAAQPHQKIVGISAVKNNFSIQSEVAALLPEGKQHSFEMLHQYHFGGYAKYTNELLQFMNEFFSLTGIPTDFVYTGKTFFAVFDLLKQNYFTPEDKLLLIHTGGLQGNRSLSEGKLIFG